MSRSARLLELLVRLPTKPRFTAQALAEEFGVSRRTMLRDLQELSTLGVPLVASPGPGGGYRLAWPHRAPALTLSAAEAIGLVLAYEAFLAYAQTPFAPAGLSAVTKLRAALPPPVLRELDRVRERVAVVAPAPARPAPLLPDLLEAALAGAALRIAYDARSGPSERVVFPVGIFAAHGLWYCACFDCRRGIDVSLRADRVRSAARVDGPAPTPARSLRDWLAARERADGGLPLRVRLTERGAKSFAARSLLGDVEGRADLLVEGSIPPSEVEWYAAQLLSLGGDAVVESPPALIAAIRRRVAELAALYPDPVTP